MLLVCSRDSPSPSFSSPSKVCFLESNQRQPFYFDFLVLLVVIIGKSYNLSIFHIIGSRCRILKSFCCCCVVFWFVFFWVFIAIPVTGKPRGSILIEWGGCPASSLCNDQQKKLHDFHEVVSLCLSIHSPNTSSPQIHSSNTSSPMPSNGPNP